MSTPQNLAGNQAGIQELSQRLLFVLIALLVYRIGTHIPVPGINPVQLAALFDATEGTILDLFNMFSGGALERMSVFALGVMPYITASIIMTLLTPMTPSLKDLRKEGESGRRTLTQYTRYLTIAIATVQGMSMSVGMSNQGLAFDPGMAFVFVATLSLVTGAMFMMWLGEQITERGVGNGISLLIFAGIVSGFPPAIGQSFESARQGDISLPALLVITVVALALVWFVVRVERAQRRITVNYARRQQGGRQAAYAAPSSHLPLKINMAGVIPAIFASSLLLAPSTMATFFGNAPGASWLQEVALWLSPGQPMYVILFSVGIVFFAFFYTAIQFDPKDIAENLKRQGAYIPGIRPGQQTARHIDDIVTRLTVVGSIYLVAVCLLPEFLVTQFNVTFQLGGTAVLIIVVVAMDFMSQVQAHLTSSQYAKLMEKSNLVGARAPRRR